MNRVEQYWILKVAVNRTNHEDEKQLTKHQAAEALGVSPETVVNWMRHGILKPARPTGAPLFLRRHVAEVRAKIATGRLDRLNRRANKSRARRRFMPEEYVADGADRSAFLGLKDALLASPLSMEQALLVLSLNRLQAEGLLEFSAPVQHDAITQDAWTTAAPPLRALLNSWLLRIRGLVMNDAVAQLLAADVPGQRDCLGLLYQSLIREGAKSAAGMYYTPPSVVEDIVSDYAKPGMRCLDPCCGTGQFLLAFADHGIQPDGLYGIDKDPVAVDIAAVNLFCAFMDGRSSFQLDCKDALFDVAGPARFSQSGPQLEGFDLVATNPPWGAHFSGPVRKSLNALYPAVASRESFSYFLQVGIRALREGGILSFILPEAVLNVKTHADIRRFILDSAAIEKIVALKRPFKHVFTRVIRLDLRKTEKRRRRCMIFRDGDSFSVDPARFQKNIDFVFNIHCDDADAAIIDQVYSRDHVTLAGRARWALGVVTGDNARHLSDAPGPGREPIYRGKDVRPYRLGEAGAFIHFEPGRYQQVAPIDCYRADEKLVYRFVSRRLVFAYDGGRALTLNSANMVIPAVPGFPVKAIAGLFNSTVYQFLFQKKFAALKVLRGHLEQLPLPLWPASVLSALSALVDEMRLGQTTQAVLDHFIEARFGLSEAAVKRIHSAVKKGKA